MIYDDPKRSCYHVCFVVVPRLRSGHEDVAAYLLDKKADVEAFGYAGMRALHHACSNSHEGSIGLLLDRGADPNPVDEFGEVHNVSQSALYITSSEHYVRGGHIIHDREQHGCILQCCMGTIKYTRYPCRALYVCRSMGMEMSVSSGATCVLASSPPE